MILELGGTILRQIIDELLIDMRHIQLLSLILIIIVVGSIFISWLAHLLLEIVVLIIVHLYLHHLLLVEHVCIDVSLVDVKYSLGCALLLVAFVSASCSVASSSAILLASSCSFEGELIWLFFT